MTNFATPATPNLADFLSFLSSQVQIPVAALPANSAWPGYALNGALGLVLCGPNVPVPFYSIACYNCATHLLFKIAPDQTGQTYFATKRAAGVEGFNLVQPSSGLVSSASDESTSVSNVNPDWAKSLTVGQLDFMRTPWGRDYLSFQQSYGPTIWGLS